VLQIEECIISFLVKNSNIPLSRSDFIRSYRKKNSSVRHEYYNLAEKYSHLDKSMFTFTVGGKGRGVYTRLRIINEVKKYATHLINVTKADIYYFASIEIGHSLQNPHIHIQLWGNDKNSIQAIYDKVIDKFDLNSKRCKLSTPYLNETSTHYDYVIKDYSKHLTDDKLWHLEQTKKRMRKTLGLKLRFYARSKSKYTQKTYRIFYRAFNVIRKKADSYIKWFYSLFFRKQRVFNTSTILLRLYINKELYEVEFLKYFFGFLGLIDVLFFSPANSPP